MGDRSLQHLGHDLFGRLHRLVPADHAAARAKQHGHAPAQRLVVAFDRFAKLDSARVFRFLCLQVCQFGNTGASSRGSPLLPLVGTSRRSVTRVRKKNHSQEAGHSLRRTRGKNGRLQHAERLIASCKSRFSLR